MQRPSFKPRTEMRAIKQTNGVYKLQGIYTLKDTTGFPVEMSYLEARDRGMEIDWVEALADALRQGIEKFDAFAQEVRTLVPDQCPQIGRIFICGIMEQPGETLEEKGRSLWELMNRPLPEPELLPILTKGSFGKPVFPITPHPNFKEQ